MNEQLDKVNRLIAALVTAWPLLSELLQERIDDRINSLIGENNEQTRGAIKELRALLDLPEALHHEREALAAALSDEDAAS